MREMTAVLSVSAALVLALATAAASQPASSTNYFMPANEASSGGQCSSKNYRLDASFGSGVTASRATSTNYRLDGGFNAALDLPIGGRPWVTATRPLHWARSHYGPSDRKSLPSRVGSGELDWPLINPSFFLAALGD